MCPPVPGFLQLHLLVDLDCAPEFFLGLWSLWWSCLLTSHYTCHKLVKVSQLCSDCMGPGSLSDPWLLTDRIQSDCQTPVPWRAEILSCDGSRSPSAQRLDYSMSWWLLSRLSIVLLWHVGCAALDIPRCHGFALLTPLGIWEGCTEVSIIWNWGHFSSAAVPWLVSCPHLSEALRTPCRPWEASQVKGPNCLPVERERLQDVRAVLCPHPALSLFRPHQVNGKSETIGGVHLHWGVLLWCLLVVHNLCWWAGFTTHKIRESIRADHKPTGDSSSPKGHRLIAFLHQLKESEAWDLPDSEGSRAQCDAMPGGLIHTWFTSASSLFTFMQAFWTLCTHLLIDVIWALGIINMPSTKQQLS
jgi:hypothetical protein